MNLQLERKRQRQTDENKREDDRRVNEDAHEKIMFKIISQKIPKKKQGHPQDAEEILIEFMKKHLQNFRQLSVQTQRVLDEEEKRFELNEAL